MNIINSLPVVRSLYRFYKLWSFRNRWHRNNRHNKTSAVNIFPMECVSVGAYSYGLLNVLSFCPSKESLKIGNFVSIGPDVTFMLGGNHQMNTITTFPAYDLIGGISGKDAESRGGIVVEDEVWICMNAIILSGVKIGKGAVIGAGAVVTRDVPPYAVVGGNPARIIRYRFPEEMIRELMNVSLIDYPEQVIREHLPLIYKEIKSVEDIRSFVEQMKK